jgi:hypothetical protein
MRRTLIAEIPIQVTADGWDEKGMRLLLAQVLRDIHLDVCGAGYFTPSRCIGYSYRALVGGRSWKEPSE